MLIAASRFLNDEGGESAVSDPVLRNPCFGMVMFQCTGPATKDTNKAVILRGALLRHGHPPEGWLTLKLRRCSNLSQGRKSEQEGCTRYIWGGGQR